MTSKDLPPSPPRHYSLYEVLVVDPPKEFFPLGLRGHAGARAPRLPPLKRDAGVAGP